MMKEETIPGNIRFRTEIIIPDASPDDISDVARAMADELEHALVDRIVGDGVYVQRGALWVPLTEDEMSKPPAEMTYTTGTSPALTFEAITKIMDELPAADPLATFRSECEVMISAWVDDAFVIDRQAGSTDAWYRDWRLSEDVKRFLVIVPSIARIGEGTRTKMQAAASYPLTDDDITTTIAYLAYEEAMRQRRERAFEAKPPAWGVFPILKVFGHEWPSS